MIILSSAFISLIIAFILFKYTWQHEIAMGLAIFGSIFLLVSIILLPVAHLDYGGQIEEFKSVKQTVESARSSNKDLENAAIQLKIADKNEWLSSMKYYNTSVFDIWVPDEVEKLKPIR